MDVKDNEGVGPLIDASSKNFLDVVQALIAAGNHLDLCIVFS